ncbi:hypothetical protein FRC12_014898 [Ceratobasidium sp. 428]|nr:hypothetical protein FRC12_014898 [Ceratobasidium sp. 428]
MSTCNSSGSSSPDSLHHFDGKHDSDTTPSPSGYRSPHFDPHTLSSKLAIYEASKSLSVAAKTLAAAAQAMSKAAASLAVASNALATKDVYDRTLVPESIFKSEDSSPNSGAWSPAWQQTSYVLSTNNTVSKPDYATRSKVLEADGLTPSAHIQYDRPPLSDKRSSGQENVDIPTSATPALESTLMSQLQTESTTSVPTTGNGNASGLVGAPEEHETMATSNEENRQAISLRSPAVAANNIA